MTETARSGNIEERCKEIEWEIADFFSIAENKKMVDSPNFSFAGTLWYIRQHTIGEPSHAITIFYLKNVTNLKHSVDCNFSLKKIDDSVKLLKKENYDLPIEAVCIKLEYLQQRKSEFAPTNALTVICTLKRKATNSDQPKILDLPKLKRLIELDTLSENFGTILANEDSCDVELHLKHKVFKAHRAVLIARSSVFAALFQHETEEKKTGIISISDCDHEYFKEFLKFLYCGKIEEPSSYCARSLFMIAHKYEVLGLKRLCVEYLKQNITVESVLIVAILADEYDEVDLFSAAEDYFNVHRDYICNEDYAGWSLLVLEHYEVGKKLMRRTVAFYDSLRK